MGVINYFPFLEMFLQIPYLGLTPYKRHLITSDLNEVAFNVWGFFGFFFQ